MHNLQELWIKMKKSKKSRFVYRKVRKKTPRATVVLDTGGEVRSVWRK